MKTKISFEYNEDEKNTSIQKIRAEDAWDTLARIEKVIKALDEIGYLNYRKDAAVMYYAIKDIKMIIEDCNLEPLDIP